MTGAQALNLIMARCGNNTNTALRANALIEMAAMQLALESGPFIPWFLMTDDTTTYATVANVESVSLPATSFIRFDDEFGGVWYKNTTITVPDQWVELVRRPYQNLKEKYTDSAAAKPVYYDLMGQKIMLRPFPDAIYNLRIMAYSHDTAPADTSATNLWLTHASDWLVSATATIVAGIHLQNAELAASLAALTKNFRDICVTEHEARMHAGQNYQMGDD